MTGATAHAICLGLVALDFAARTLRMQVFLRALRHPRPFGEVLVQIALGETASTLTPLRAGGEPARIWLMRHQGIPAGAGVVGAGIDFLATTSMILVVAVALGVTIGGEWWATAGPSLMRSAAGSGPVVAAILVATMVAWLLVERYRPDLTHGAAAELRLARQHLRDVPLRAYVLTAPLSLVNIAARAAILPVLAQTLSHPPPLAATIVGSFALLNAQAVIPTPAGAGAVDVGFLAGAAGSMGAAEARLLLLWRFYTSVVGSTLGVVLTLARYHRNIIPFVLRRRAVVQLEMAPTSSDDPLGPLDDGRTGRP